MRVAIIDYGSGNLRSAAKAFERAAHNHHHAHEIIVSNSPEAVLTADRVVLPGVGAFADCRKGLQALTGMEEALNEVVRNKARPFLGICVGMQLLATRGLEFETSQGLDWVAGDVVSMDLNDPDLKIPHMGWNTLNLQHKDHVLLQDIETGPDGLHAYFVHSYHFQPRNSKNQIATFNYGGEFTAIVGEENIIGTQFHPEKSQKLGLQFISNFLSWAP
ncbi:imidazole glycerol phosphate synthase subunit HisH [Flexibacterium corallicola]|uniref:imidazole glycerol phosphate synthase subunit HisH n=1 Tax=Flexibacterium corallicola TaxID=3037259 RepID=UPI00286F1814|nr:imidazole glycerol phosphate synthase subunit HisH [Pseudovibrio sp. M1P-2-3]